MQDFLGYFRQTNIYPYPKTPRGVKFYFSLAIIVLLVSFFGFVIYSGFNVFFNAKSAKENLLAAKIAASSLKFNEAKASLQNSNADFIKASSAFGKIGFFRYLPLMKDDFAAAENILIIGKEASAGLLGSVEIISEILSDYGNAHELNLSGLSPEDKKKILGTISQSAPKIEAVKQNLGRARLAYGHLPAKSVFGLEKLILPYSEKFLELESETQTLLSLLEVFPSIVGFTEPKTYLFLLQNNTELRPSGGFLGAYGIASVASGEVKSFFTADTYALDRQAVGFLRVLPPAPLKKYLGIQYLYMRDANWSPDFSVSAASVEDFYHQEGGREKINGVIAVTPDVVADILRILGPIKVDGQEFNADNLTDALEYRVEVGFLEKGIPRIQRKEIIGRLAKELLGKIYALPLRDWAAIFGSISRGLEEKHLLAVSADAEVQKIFDEESWSGKVMDTASDYFMFIDANLNALKSDPEVAREITYSLKKDGGTLSVPDNHAKRDEKYVAEAKIYYKHSGKKDWKTGRYRTYLRLFAPLGSKLVYLSGGDNENVAGKADIGEELGKTYFGIFATVEVGAERELVFRYELPERIKYQIEQNLYSLSAEKQPGAAPYHLTINLNFDKKILGAAPAGTVDSGAYKLDTDLRIDRMVTIGF